MRRPPPHPDVTLSPSAATVTRVLSITEGASATYNVQLGQQPQGSVNVQIRTPVGSGVSTSACGLVFNASNWNTARVITVEARDDANVVGETVRIRHYVDDGQISNDYDPAPDAVPDGERDGQRRGERADLYVNPGGAGATRAGRGADGG